jgi:hypothetical protein
MNVQAANRLKEAARKAGYRTAAAFARAVGSEETTMRSHFNGNRSFNREDAKRYAAKINQSLPAGDPPVTWQWLLDGDEAGAPMVVRAAEEAVVPPQAPQAASVRIGTEYERSVLEKTIIEVRTVFAAAGIDNPEAESKAITKLFEERRARLPR